MLRPITEEEYTLLRDLINRESGISFARLRREVILSRISRRLKELNFERFHDYYERVLNDSDELSDLIDRVSTNVTQFFREPKQFDFLSLSAIPDILSTAPKKIRVWSAGCSTGEEPYTIAMAFQEAFDRYGVRNPDFKILASDISSRVLKRAEEGIYTAEDVSQVPPQFLSKYFLAGVGRNEGFYQAKKVLRDSILFRHINLTAEVYPVRGVFDMIFCRNVIIYFDKAIQDRVVNSLLRFLKPGGYLLCGHSESLIGLRNMLRAVQPCIYRKETASVDGERHLHKGI